MKLIPLKYDLCVKEVMDNETVRKHFLSDVLGIPLEDIKSARVINPFLWRRHKKQKLGILDIKLELNDNTKINIEVQLKPKVDWEKRTVFYLAKMFTSDLRRGEDYEKAKKCIAITILDFNIDSRKGYHHAYMLRDETGEVYADVLELHTIELKKRPDADKPSPLDEWHSLFNAQTEEELKMIREKTKNNGIIEAIKEIQQISFTKIIRMEYEMHLKAKRDRYAEDKYVFEQGREDGIKLGREQGREQGREDGIRLGREQGREDGIRLGREQGREDGIRLGREQGREDGIRLGREDGINALIKSLRRNGLSDAQIVAEIIQEYGLGREEAMERVRSR